MPLSPDTTTAVAAPVRRGESIRGAFRNENAAIHQAGADPNQAVPGGLSAKKFAPPQKKQPMVDLDAIFAANYNTLGQNQKKQDTGAPPLMKSEGPQQDTNNAGSNFQKARVPPSPPRREALRPPAFYADAEGRDSKASKDASGGGGASRDFFARSERAVVRDQQAAPKKVETTGGAAGAAMMMPSPIEDDTPIHVTQSMLHRFESALERDISTLRAHAGLRQRHGVERSWRHADHCAACAGSVSEAGGRRRAASTAVTRQEQRVLLVVEGQEPRASAMDAAIDAFVAEVARLTRLVEAAEADLNAELQGHATDTSALQALEQRVWDALTQLTKMFRSRHREASTRTQAIYDSIVPVEEVCAAAERHLAEVTVLCGKADTLGMACLGAAKRARGYLQDVETHNADTRDCIQGVDDQMEQEQHARGIVCARLNELCDTTAREVASAEGALKAMRGQIRAREKDGGLTAELRCDGGAAAAAGTATAGKGGEADSEGLAPLFGRLATIERHCGHLSSAGAHLLCLKCATAAVNREAAAVQRQLERSGAGVGPAVHELESQVAAAAHALEAAAASRHSASFSSAALVGAVEVAQAFDAAEEAMQERAEAARELQQAVRGDISKARAERIDVSTA